jgi:hypothetical protein
MNDTFTLAELDDMCRGCCEDVVEGTQWCSECYWGMSDG